MTRKTNKNTIHVPIWSTQIIMKSYWIVCILNNRGNDSKVSMYELEVNTWTQYVQQLVRRNLTVMAGACRVIHPGAPPKPSPGPMSVRTSLLQPHERAAERSVEAVRVLASRQLTAAWAWWDVRSRPAQGNGDRPRLSFRVFHQSLWDCAGRLRRTSLVVLAACKDLTDGFMCVCVGHVIQTRDRGVFVLHGCYQERKTAEKRRILLFHAFRGRQFYHRGTQSWAAGGVVKRSLAAGRPIHQLKDERRLWSFVLLIGSLDVCCLKRADRMLIWAFCSLFL